MTTVDVIELIAGEGIQGEPRYCGRRSSSTGAPSRRQVSLIEREQIASHAESLRLEAIPPGVVRANIETTGVTLGKLIGCRVRVGEAILHFYEHRTPCAKMDAISAGLRALMEDGRQGVLAEAIQSGRIRVGDPISLLEQAGGKGTS